VALRAVSVQSGRVVASVTTTKTIYSVQVHGSAFQFAAIDQLRRPSSASRKTLRRRSACGRASNSRSTR